MSRKINLCFILLFIVLQSLKSQEVTDSISFYIRSAKELKQDPQQANLFLKRALILTNIVENDSLKVDYLIDIAYRHYKLGHGNLFRSLNLRSRDLSRQLKDTLHYAETYWDLGMYFDSKNVNDSAYYAFYEAKKNYVAKGEKLQEGRMLLNMAIAQNKSKDYTGSEITTIQALVILKTHGKNRQMYGCYNNLGIIYNGLEDFESSLEYHQRALKFLDGVKGRKSFELGTLNNIGVVYEKKQEYSKALDYFKKALSVQDLAEMRKDQYAKLVDNSTYMRFKRGDKEGLEADFLMALAIRDSIDDYDGQAINQLHLAEYYLNEKDTVQALSYLNENYTLTKETKNNEDLLSTLKLLSLVDKKNSIKYFSAYTELNDSLYKMERQIRNKFVRIRYETEEHEGQSIRLAKVNQRLWWIGGLGFLLVTALFVIRAQTLKNRNLKSERLQQASNEEIYAVMLNQQQHIEQVKNAEKRRISEELHDGVLGKLFGTRLLLDTINRNTDEESILLREKHISDLQQIEEEVRNVSHELNEKSYETREGYEQLIENLLEEQSLISKFKYAIDADVNWQKIDSTLKMNVYRILQESIQNINKYAQAKNVKINFKEIDQRLYCTIVDDGVGFNPIKKKKGIGLKNIASRVAKLSGSVKFESSANQGTQILFDVPV